MLSPIETLKIFQNVSEPKTVLAGDTIFNAGEMGETMFGILEGEVEMSVNGKVIETLLAGEVFGEGALVHEDHLRASTAKAKTNCKLAVMNKRHFIFAVQETPEFALEVMRSYSDRFRRLKSLF